MTATDSSAGNSYDVIVVGGGPAGSTISTLLTQNGLRVALCERERFPRFHVGESFLPANLPIFDHLGCHDAVRQACLSAYPELVRGEPLIRAEGRFEKIERNQNVLVDRLESLGPIARRVSGEHAVNDALPDAHHFGHR